jgi:WD40 repeat protein
MGVLGLGTCSATQCGKAGVKATWEPGSNVLASGSNDKTIKLWELQW